MTLLAEKTGYTPYQILWDIPQDEIFRLIEGVERAGKIEYIGRIDAMAKSIALVFGDKKARNSIISELRKFDLRKQREMTDEIRFEMLEQYEVKEDDKK